MFCTNPAWSTVSNPSPVFIWARKQSREAVGIWREALWYRGQPGGSSNNQEIPALPGIRGAKSGWWQMEKESSSVPCSICSQSAPGQAGEGTFVVLLQRTKPCRKVWGRTVWNLLIFFGFGCVQLGMRCQGMLPGGATPWWPPRNGGAFKRQQTAAHSCAGHVKPLRDGAGILLGKEESTGIRAVAFTEPPRLCEPLGDGVWGWNSLGILLDKEKSTGIRAVSLSEPPAQPEVMFGFTPSRFYTKAAFSLKGKSYKDQGQNKSKTKRIWM